MIIRALEFIADYTEYAFIAFFFFLLIAVVVRVIIKMRRKEDLTITPVGIVNDLPDSVTGINKYSEALNTDSDEDKGNS